MAAIDDSTKNGTLDTADGGPAGALAARGRGAWRVFDAIFERYRPFVRRLLARRRDILPASVDDLIQKVFTTLSQQMSRTGPIKNPEAVLVTIVGHEVSNHGRLRKPDVEPEDAAAEVPSAEPDPERWAEVAERRRQIQAHLDAMDPGEAELILCGDILEMTYAEMAAALKRPESTVAYQYTRARAILDARIREARSADGASSA